jgi:hypothetical protein
VPAYPLGVILLSSLHPPGRLDHAHFTHLTHTVATV